MRNFALGFVSALILLFLITTPRQFGDSTILTYDSSLKEVVDQINWLTFKTDDCNITCPECPDCSDSNIVYSNNFDTNASGWNSTNGILTVVDGELESSYLSVGERLAYLAIPTKENQWYEIHTKVSSAVVNKLRLAVSETSDTFVNALYIWGWADGFNPVDSNQTTFRFKAVGNYTYIMFGDESSVEGTYTAIDYMHIEKSTKCPEPEPCICDCNTTFAEYTERYKWDVDNASGYVTIVYGGDTIVQGYDDNGSGTISHMDEHVYRRGNIAKCFSDKVGYQVYRELHDSFHRHCCMDTNTETECIAQGGIPAQECIDQNSSRIKELTSANVDISLHEGCMVIIRRGNARFVRSMNNIDFAFVIPKHSTFHIDSGCWNKDGRGTFYQRAKFIDPDEHLIPFKEFWFRP